MLVPMLRLYVDEFSAWNILGWTFFGIAVYVILFRRYLHVILFRRYLQVKDIYLFSTCFSTFQLISSFQAKAKFTSTLFASTSASPSAASFFSTSRHFLPFKQISIKKNFEFLFLGGNGLLLLPNKCKLHCWLPV